MNLHEEIVLPSYKEVIYLPESEEYEGTAATFKGGYTIEESKLILNETISIKKRLFKPDEWDNYKSVVKAQQKFADEKVILSR